MAHLGDLTANLKVFGKAEDAIVETLVTDPYASWKHRLAGTVSVDSTPSSRRVHVMNRMGRYVASCFSEADGTWEIKGLGKQFDGIDLAVLCFDDTGTYNAQSADRIRTVGSV